jgi:hypothetical protein
MNADVLVRYEFHVQIAEADVRDGDANPWERVVVALAAEVRALRKRVAELEADAKLGRLAIDARDAALASEWQWSAEGIAKCDWCGHRYGDPPTHNPDCIWGAFIAALEAARKEEPY